MFSVSARILFSIHSLFSAFQVGPCLYAFACVHYYVVQYAIRQWLVASAHNNGTVAFYVNQSKYGEKAIEIVYCYLCGR